MSKHIKVARVGGIPENEGIVVKIDGRPIAIFNNGGKYYALDDTCPHEGGSLGQGGIEEDVVVCPWHEWRFNIETGESHEIPGFYVDTFPVIIKGNDVCIEM